MTSPPTRRSPALRLPRAFRRLTPLKAFWIVVHYCALLLASLLVISPLAIAFITSFKQPIEMLRGRLHPIIPPEGLNAFCFYPMSKKRESHANWFSTPYERRQEMMMEHGKSGRAFAGKIAQVISGSTGLDDFEWGVTLFAQSPDVIKEVVYTMRFDEGSALYGEFGAFYVGYLDAIENIV